MSSRTRRWSAALVAAPLIAFLLAVGAATPAFASDWEMIAKENGVIVKQKEVEGRDLPIFQGTTLINANVVDILAVMNDTASNTAWMHNCAEARQLQKVDEYNRVVYNRTDAPWPVDDRDVVVKSKVTINFKSIASPLQGPVDGVVRMNRLSGFLSVQDHRGEQDPGHLPDRRRSGRLTPRLARVRHQQGAPHADAGQAAQPRLRHP